MTSPKIRPKIGLALGSGVARGWAHIGALRALIRAGYMPDVICGTSIGALVGGFYLAGHLDVLEEWARELGIRLELVRWETHAYPSFGEDPQSVINEQIPDDYDLRLVDVGDLGW